MAKDFYAVLGVEPDDDVTIIKRRYRQMVRQYHPDVAANREAAHEMMLSINEAWTTLSDPAERARYDRARRPQMPPPPAKPAPAQAKSGAATAPSQQAQQSAPRAAPRGTTTRSASRSGSTRTRLLSMVFEAAELYFFHGRAQEAIETCRRVMKYDPNNAEAPALLGDIFAEQGNKNDAIKMYQTAVLNQPNNKLYQQKLANLRGDSGAGHTMPDAAASGAGVRSREGLRPRATTAAPSSAPAPAAPASGAVWRGNEARKKTAAAKSARAEGINRNLLDAPTRSPASQDRARVTAGLLLLAAATGVVIWSSTVPLDPASVVASTRGEFESETIAATTLGALLLGAALPLLGIVRRCGQIHRGEPKFMGLPFLIILAGAGAAYFPAAIGVFLLASLIRRNWQSSIFTVLIFAAIWSSMLLLSSDKPDDSRLLQEALVRWSGQAVFPAMLVGWLLGSQSGR